MKLPITHFELISKDPEKYFGYSMADIIKSVPEGFDFMHWKDFVEKSHDFARLAHLTGDEQMNMTIRMIYHIVRMQIYGEKIYHISREVCDMIMNTRPTIDAEFIESPFEEIYLSMDQDEIVVTDYSGTRPVKGIYISLRVEADGIKKLRFLATSGVDGMDKLTDVNHFACFHIPEHGNLEEIFNQQMAKFQIIPGAYQVQEKIIHNIFKFAVGCLLYIGCRNANLFPYQPLTVAQAIADKGPKKAKIIARRMERQNKLPFIYVTNNHSFSSSGVTGTGKKLDHEVLVGGYWRGQWYGSEKAGDRRKSVIRIASYVKGVGDRENKQYVIK